MHIEAINAVATYAKQLIFKDNIIMATERVKVYEDGKRGGVPVWAWLLPLLLLLGLLGWFLMHRHTAPAIAAAPPGAVSGAASGMPNLGSVHFATDQATLMPDGQATLTRAADYMKQHPDAHMRVEGYTDATGTDPHNENLSQRRAGTVVQFLQGQGIATSRLTGEGFGPQKPRRYQRQPLMAKRTTAASNSFNSSSPSPLGDPTRNRTEKEKI